MLRVLPVSAIAIFVGVTSHLMARSLDDMVSSDSDASVSACFTPEQKCAPQIIDRINEAKTSISVMQLFMNQPGINKALIRAHDRGINVRAIVDYESLKGLQDTACTSQKPVYIGPETLVKAGLPVFVDDSVKTAHNKVTIIDGQVVIGGSYNYTDSAEKQNAENVTFISSKSVANEFTAEWERRLAASEPLASSNCKASS